VEVVLVVRGRALSGKLGSVRAQEAVDVLPSLVIDQVDITGLVDRMWQLRGSITPYDAAYVASAERLGCPLVTADGRLAKANGMRCEIRLVSPDSRG
jgi:predicted nucleic acid-binding protein